ncbi:MAG: BPL-N domain-containing protein [Verrucomicrobiota bacterium]
MRYLGLKIGLFTAVPFFGLQAADVAVYFQAPWPDGGAYPPLAVAAFELMEDLNYEVEYIDAADVNANRLGEYRMLFFPGGWAGGYNDFISETGKQNIRDFVSSGGSYMGMCAGSFFISERVFWREGPGEDTEQNIYNTRAGYTLDMWNGVSDGAIFDFQPWNTSAIGCNLFPGARMVDLTIDQELVPEAEASVNVLYWGGPIYRPPGGKWSNEKIIARYDMDGFSGHEEPAIVTFPYGEGRILMSAVHPELSINESTCEFFDDDEPIVGARVFLSHLVQRMMVPVEKPELAAVSGVRLLTFETLLGMRYQVQSSVNGSDWTDYGEVVAADSFDYLIEIPVADSELQFRITMID